MDAHKTVRFLSDFRKLNTNLKRKPFLSCTLLVPTFLSNPRKPERNQEPLGIPQELALNFNDTVYFQESVPDIFVRNQEPIPRKKQEPTGTVRAPSVPFVDSLRA